ncbi:unnamed protein product [Linum tenue]|uniref:Uncharacterized protein n=1 Tax=Linum tenue TaxID=586396 RepID=A0AAV0QY39_9ROSI|nr:unnamed protein product [Linum tenue]
MGCRFGPIRQGVQGSELRSGQATIAPLHSHTGHSRSTALHLTLTVVVPDAAAAVMKEIGQRMEKFARLMGVPFEFCVVAGRLADLTGDQLALAVNDDATHAGERLLSRAVIAFVVLRQASTSVVLSMRALPPPRLRRWRLLLLLPI